MLGGIFIGGRSRRMGGFPKALLRSSSGETLLARTLHVVREAGLEPILVGDAPPEVQAEAAQAHPRMRSLPDAAQSQGSRGPLGGLVALFDAAQDESVIALACDMPRVDAALLRRLIETAPEAAAVAPRRGTTWEPLCARYDARRVGPVARARLAMDQLALQGLLNAVSTAALDLTDASIVDDVDTMAEAARQGFEGWT